MNAVSIELSFGALALLALVVALYGIKRYYTPLNPLTLFAGMQIGLLTLVSGLVANSRLPTAPYAEAGMVFTVLVSGVYLVGTMMAYLVRVVELVSLFTRGMRTLGLASETMATRFNPVKFSLLLAGAVGAFAALAILGHGGLLWLTDSRSAYLMYRAGVGPFFALTQWCLALAFLYYLWARHPRLLGILAGLFLFSVLSYFTGSKNNILTMVIVAIAYYNFRVRSIPLSAFAVFVPLLFLAVLQLLVTQGSYAGLSQAIAYFNDYFDTTARFLARFDEFGFYCRKALQRRMPLGVVQQHVPSNIQGFVRALAAGMPLAQS